MHRVLRSLPAIVLVAALVVVDAAGASGPVTDDAIIATFVGDHDLDSSVPQHRLDIRLQSPNSIAFAPDGDLVIGERHTGRILRVAAGSGIVTEVHVAADGIESVAVDRNGDIYYSLPSSFVVKRVDPTGTTVGVVAGTGIEGDSGDGGLSGSAQFEWPADLAIDREGRVLYVSDSDASRVRAVDLDTGIISTVAGTGSCGFDGDGTATTKRICGPMALAVDPVGGLYVSDTGNGRVRYVDVSGFMRTVAGSDAPGFSGEGGPAIDAGLGTITGLAVTPGGDLYLADESTYRLLSVDRNGILRTVAGDGTIGNAGDGGPSGDAHVGLLGDVTVGPSGRVYVADRLFDAVRAVYPGPFFGDVADTHPFFEQVQWMWVSGTSNGSPQPGGLPSFKPQSVVRRQAMAAFLYRLAGSPPVGAAPFFSDVGPSHPFFAAINWMGEAGVSTGVASPGGGKPLFKPQDVVRRQAMAAFLHRLHGPPFVGVGETFADVGASHQFFFEIEWMGQAGVSTGSPNPGGGKPLFKPRDVVRRQAMAAFLYRIEVTPA